MDIRTSAPDATRRTEDEAGPETHNGHIQRKLVPQVTYKAARQQKELEGPRIIDFSVYGEKGIRLSDALEENWVGFEGRDDRSLFGDDRVQIMIRLHVRAASNRPRIIPTTNFPLPDYWMPSLAIKGEVK